MGGRHYAPFLFIRALLKVHVYTAQMDSSKRWYFINWLISSEGGSQTESWIINRAAVNHGDRNISMIGN